MQPFQNKVLWLPNNEKYPVDIHVKINFDYPIIEIQNNNIVRVHCKNTKFSSFYDQIWQQIGRLCKEKFPRTFNIISG